MRKGKFSEEQIIGFLRQAEVGMPVKQIGRKHGFSNASFYVGVRRKNFYGSGAPWAGQLAATMYGVLATLVLWSINARAPGWAPTCRPVPTAATGHRLIWAHFFPGPWTRPGSLPCALCRPAQVPAQKCSTLHERGLRAKISARMTKPAGRASDAQDTRMGSPNIYEHFYVNERPADN